MLGPVDGFNEGLLAGFAEGIFELLMEADFGEQLATSEKLSGISVIQAGIG